VDFVVVVAAVVVHGLNPEKGIGHCYTRTFLNISHLLIVGNNKNEWSRSS
jgi:hypothetical protein